MTQPNFLQVQNSLDRACAFCAAHPDLSSSERYGVQLPHMRDRWAQCTQQTDRKYTEWRKALGVSLGHLRAIKVAYDGVLEIADEHGYDDAPTRRIIYTESTALYELIDTTIAWLKSKDDEWAWLGERASELAGLQKTARLGEKHATTLYQQFTIEVKKRVSAYDDAVAVLREYLKDAHREGGRYEEFDALALDVL